MKTIHSEVHFKGHPYGTKEPLCFVTGTATNAGILRIDQSTVAIRSASIIFLRVASQQTQKIVPCGPEFTYGSIINLLTDRTANWAGNSSYTEKTIFPIPFTLNGIWSWWQFSLQFLTKWNSIWFKIERKTVTTIISHSIWKEIEYEFYQCILSVPILFGKLKRYLRGK